MNNHSLMLFLSSLFAWFVVRHFYRNSIHPYLMDVARFKIFAARDQLRKLQMTREFNEKELTSIKFLEQTLSSTVKRCTVFRLGEFIARTRYQYPKFPERLNKRYEEFRKNLPEEFISVEREFGFAAFLLMVSNSPLLVFLILVIIYPYFRAQRIWGEQQGWKKIKRDFNSFAHSAPNLIA